MTTKTSKAAAFKASAPKAKKTTMTTVPQAVEPGKAAARASMALRPSVNAAAVMVSYTGPLGLDDQGIGELVEGLSAGMNDLWAGDMKRAEAMLYGQAHALQAIFMNFARRAQAQEYQKNLESFLRLALKAQNQCRMTLETLATIKNPPVVFAKQANINNGGQQQVNNGGQAPGTPMSEPACAHAANSKPDQTGLLGVSDGQWLDTGAPGAASSADPQLAPVGEVHRPAHR